MCSIRASSLNHLNVGHSRQVRCFNMSKLPRVRLPSLVLECIQNSGRTGYAQPRIAPPRKEGRKKRSDDSGRWPKAISPEQWHHSEMHMAPTPHHPSTVYMGRACGAKIRSDVKFRCDTANKERNCRCLRGGGGGRCDARVFLPPTCPCLTWIMHCCAVLTS